MPGVVPRHPVILMLGSLETNRVPDWSTNLVREGYMLAAFSAGHPPDPDPARRAQWLNFDARFAHSYALGAKHAIADTRRVMENLTARKNVLPDKIGWLGSSSTGIPALAVATQGPRLAAVVAFVSTGAYRQWFDTWQPNGLWRGTNYALWPETEKVLQEIDPVLHAEKLFPTPVLMVSGGEDKIVDPKTARAFVEAARPAYQNDPERLELVIYDGFGHNLPAGVIQLYAEYWFHRYLNPSTPAPASAAPPATLAQSVVQSQINAASHDRVVGAITNKLDWIKVSDDRRGFVMAGSGTAFKPWGFNYDRDFRMRLLEDYWETEWQTVVEDFREMKQLGASVVRIHLQFAKFMDGANRPNAKALAKLRQLLELAEATGLYLDITGLGCYRQSDTPKWYDGLKEADRWRAQADFWEAVAECCAGSPAVFCYDLMNEPVVPGAKRDEGDWLTGKLEGFSYVQFITLDPARRPRTEIAKEWIAGLAGAIRRRDARHLVTLGMLPNSLPDSPFASGFVPGETTRDLDFLCVHMYPRTGEFEQDMKTLRGFNVGKPLVVEEIFPLTCTTGELRQFITEARPLVVGWIGFYWGQMPDELRRSKAGGAGLTAAWLDLFQELTPQKKSPPRPSHP